MTLTDRELLDLVKSVRVVDAPTTNPDPDVRFLELRDRATCIPLVVSRTAPHDGPARRLWFRSGYGYGGPAYLFWASEIDKASSDPYVFLDGRYAEQLLFVERNFSLLKDGDVIDKRVWTGESDSPEASDCTGPSAADIAILAIERSAEESTPS